MSASPTLEQLYSDPATGLSRSSFLESAKKALFSRKEALAFYRNQSTTQVHAPNKRVYNSIVAAPGSWAVDLMFMDNFAGLAANRKFSAAIVCIEQTCRFAWVRPLRSKEALEVAERLAELIREHDVRSLTTDGGNEFRAEVSALLERHGVKHYASSRKGSTSRVERLIRTLRERLSRAFEESNSHVWVPILQSTIDSYNSTPSRACLGYTPAECLASPQLASEVRAADYARGIAADVARMALEDGTPVRTALAKARFEKKSGPKWSTDVGTIELDKDARGSKLLRVRRADGSLDRRHYASWELAAVPAQTRTKERLASAPPVSASAEPARVDVPQVRKERRASQQRQREGIFASNVVAASAGARSTRGVLPSRYRDP